MPTINYAALVPIPGDGAMNSGLSPTGKSLQNRFGKPGKLTKNCSPVTNTTLKTKIVRADVGPFTVTGLRPAVESLKRIFEKVRTGDPGLYGAMKTAGMLCCRQIRGIPGAYSIHSFGAAIDLYCGTGVVPLGSSVTHLGVLRLYPHLHAEGWYWGAEFTRRDAMHFEVARETVKQWIRQKLI